MQFGQKGGALSPDGSQCFGSRMAPFRWLGKAAKPHTLLPHVVKAIQTTARQGTLPWLCWTPSPEGIARSGQGRWHFSDAPQQRTLLMLIAGYGVNAAGTDVLGEILHMHM